MRTNVDIDDKLMAEARKLSGLKSKKDVVNSALKEFVRHQHRLDILKLPGTVEFWDNYEKDYKKMRINPRNPEDPDFADPE